MKKLIEISNKAVADYGFRQIVQWSPDDIVAQWQLSTREAELLTGVIKDELDPCRFRSNRRTCRANRSGWRVSSGRPWRSRRPSGGAGLQTIA